MTDKKTKPTKNKPEEILRRIYKTTDPHRPQLRCYRRAQVAGVWSICATDTHRIAIIPLPDGKYTAESISDCGMPVDGTFPNVEKVIPETSVKVSVNAGAFKSMIETFVRAKCNAWRCIFTLEPGKLSAYVEVNGLKIESSVPCDWKSDATEKFAFNCRYLLDAMPQDGEGDVVLNFVQGTFSTRPMAITYEGVPKFEGVKYVVMPMAIG